MVSILVVVFGLLTGSFMAALIGLVGARRRIGFGWAFVLSLIFTPLIGLIITLISDPLPGVERRWGCLPTLLSILTIIFFLVLLSLIFMGSATMWMML